LVEVPVRRRIRTAAVLALLLLTRVSAAGHAATVTRDRIEALPAECRPDWLDYLERSAALARRDRERLAAEVAAAGLSSPVCPPSGEGLRGAIGPQAGWYAGPEAGALADAVLSYQSPSGGWAKHNLYTSGIRQPGVQWTSQSAPGRPFHYLATFDNHVTTAEVTLLARVARATGRHDCEMAVSRGLRFMLEAQFPSGGWPQVYPLEGGYHDAITFNDDAMLDVLEVLSAVAKAEEPYPHCDATLRQEAARAVQRGLECVLATQVVRDGHRTGWCAQYDAVTLEPVGARAYEPAALGGIETSHVLKWLMKQPTPNGDIVSAIEAGVAWLVAVRIQGLKKTTRDGRTAYVEDAASREVYWARFYDLGSGRPIFPGRDGVIYDTFEAMASRNRLGYDYLSGLPRSVVTNGANTWRKRSTR
jgi:PelA/Pel-15E family pectate lyase